MKNNYHQITQEERDQIAILEARGNNYSQIAKIMNRNRSTILREVKRNSSRLGHVYTPHQAQKKAQQRKSNANTHPRINNSLIQWYVHDKLKQDWSPEQIAGRLPKDHPGHTISHEAIYQYIYFECPEFKMCLARSHRIRKKRRSFKSSSVNRIPNRIAIDQRPDEANDRLSLGHWEGDTIVSRQSSSSLAVLLDRRARYTLIKKIQRNGADEFSNAIINRLKSMHPSKRKTITFDNGKENMNHQHINHSIDTQSYFCAPYHSWEKGSVENTAGLIRRYLPKKTDFAKVSDDQITYIEYQLNSRPRKCLNYLTPAEVFSSNVALPG